MATKLVQWLTVFTLFTSVWISLVFKLIPVQLDDRVMEVLWPLPIYLLVAFGSYSLATIGYRVATFNDCEDAAASLKAVFLCDEVNEKLRLLGNGPSWDHFIGDKEIEEAKADLTRKGFKFS